MIGTPLTAATASQVLHLPLSPFVAIYDVIDEGETRLIVMEYEKRLRRKWQGRRAAQRGRR